MALGTSSLTRSVQADADAIAGLRERFSKLELLEEPVRRPGLAIRALDSLPVRFVPR